MYSVNNKLQWMHQLYGVHAGKCKDCQHLIKKSHNDRCYYKCLAYGDSCSTATDWRVGWSACGLITDEQLPNGHIPVGQQLKHLSRPLRRIDCDGQTSMWNQINGEV